MIDQKKVLLPLNRLDLIRATIINFLDLNGKLKKLKVNRLQITQKNSGIIISKKNLIILIAIITTHTIIIIIIITSIMTNKNTKPVALSLEENLINILNQLFQENQKPKDMVEGNSMSEKKLILSTLNLMLKLQYLILLKTLLNQAIPINKKIQTNKREIKMKKPKNNRQSMHNNLSNILMIWDLEKNYIPIMKRHDKPTLIN